MLEQIRAFLDAMPHFAMLPKGELEQVAKHVTLEKIAKGSILGEQGKTTLNQIYIVRRGKLSLYDENHGRRKLSGYYKPGDVFGGITLLMNGGLSLRTALAEEDTEVYLMPQEKFLDLCARYKDFYSFFLENFSKHISDPALNNIIASGQARRFLTDIAPFSFLPEEVVEQAARDLTIVFHPKGTLLFIQGRTRVGHLYILQKGSAQRYYEQDGQKTMCDILGEGDIYGGISMLLNDGLSVRTLEVNEDSYIYLLPKDTFVQLCNEHPVFSEYFTDTFGKRMLNKSYAAIIARSVTPPEEDLQFFNQPVHQIYNTATVFGTPDMTIQQVALRMRQENSSYLMIPSSDPQSAGIITESDLTRKVIANGYDIHGPAVDIMSKPLGTVKESALIIEALTTMMQGGIKHLAVTDPQDQVVGMLSNRELLSAQGQSPLLLLRKILTTDSMEDIISQHQRLPELVKGLISNGATARNINRLITTVSDAILKKVIKFALQEMQPPPASFVFMILGSEGRSEQTLKTDQDNAIIFKDVPKAELPEVNQYFLELGQRVCTLLDQAGYAFCEGDVMAKNPKWCQPLSVWKAYFRRWVHAAEPKDLLQASIFFDFRGGYGDMQLVDQLRDQLNRIMKSQSGFLRYLTESALEIRPPLGFFRNFVVESKGEHRDAFDIKSAMMPIVGFARVYALKNGVEATNTLDRLYELRMKDILTQQEHDELEKAYSFLMQLRFTRQVTVAKESKKPLDNFINPKLLTRIEQIMLKEIFKRIEKFQAKMNFDFIGIA